MPDLLTEALLCAFSLEYFVSKVNDLFKMPKTVPSIYRSDNKELRDVHMHCFTSRAPVSCENIRFPSLFVAGDVPRETPPPAKSEEKRMFSQARAPAVQNVACSFLTLSLPKVAKVRI